MSGQAYRQMALAEMAQSSTFYGSTNMEHARRLALLPEVSDEEEQDNGGTNFLSTSRLFYMKCQLFIRTLCEKLDWHFPYGQLLYTCNFAADRIVLWNGQCPTNRDYTILIASEIAWQLCKTFKLWSSHPNWPSKFMNGLLKGWSHHCYCYSNITTV